MTMYVYSALGQDTIYTDYIKMVDLPVIKQQVYVKGGVGVANKNLITPRGVRTEVSDAEYEFLKNNEVFKQHIKNGFIAVEKYKEKAEKVAANSLKEKDGSAQKTPEEFEKERNSLPEGMRPASLKSGK